MTDHYESTLIKRAWDLKATFSVKYSGEKDEYTVMFVCEKLNMRLKESGRNRDRLLERVNGIIEEHRILGYGKV